MGVWAAALQGVLGADSNIQQGIADRKQALANTELANEAAADALQRGALDGGRIRSAGTKLAAQQKVAYTGSGVDASVGTAADVQTETGAQTELEASIAENNAAREAWGYKAHGLAFQAQAGINASRRNRELAGGILGSAGEAAGAYSKTGWGF